MKKGFDYGDSNSQRLISSNIKEDLTALTERLKAYPEYYRDVILYIAPYFSTTSSLLEAITGINGRLQDAIPKFLRDNKVNLPRRLLPMISRSYHMQNMKKWKKQTKRNFNHL